jgi:GNAT superfamily N-acetyltransferase
MLAALANVEQPCSMARAVRQHRQTSAHMTGIRYREATASDIEEMAQIRTDGGWTGGASAERMGRYLAGTHHPQQARAARRAYVAEDSGRMVGFVAGHLTARLECDGEVQWLYVIPARRGGEIATGLLARMAAWFLDQHARRICVNVEPENRVARRFYQRRGARALNQHWLVWDDVTDALAKRVGFGDRLSNDR